MITVSGFICIILLVASIPSICGISTSIRTICGLNFKNISTASAPFVASTTSKPFFAKIHFRAKRISWLSSAIKIVIIKVKY